jgi:hypothetical protein
MGLPGAYAPHAPSRARTLGSLHVSSVVHMVNSLHLTGRRQLAWRTGHLRCMKHAESEDWPNRLLITRRNDLQARLAELRLALRRPIANL